MLETERLFLRKMDEDDFNELHKIFTDKKVMEAFESEPFTREQMEYWLKRNLDHQEKYGYGLFAVILKSNQELIGDCGLEHTDFEEKPCVEIGYDFLSRYWNRGYATEAAGAVKKYAIERLSIERQLICSFIRKQNKASQRVSEKVGMQRIREYRANGADYYLYGFSTEYFDENGNQKE